MNTILIGKAVLPLVMAALSLLLFEVWRRTRPSQTALSWTLVLLWAGSRFAVFIGLYIVLDFAVPSDVSAYYLPQARSALDGLLIYRDFPSNYGPLFPYIAACSLLVYNAPESIVLLTILIEGSALFAWTHVGRRFFTDKTVSLATLIYLCSGAVLFNVPVAGQNQVWLSAGLAGSLLVAASHRHVTSGAVAGLGLLATKVLFLVPVPALFFGTQKRWRWLTGFLLVSIVGYAAVAFAGGNVLMPILDESGNWTSGNVPYLLTLLGLDLTTSGSNLALLALLGGGLASTYLAATIPVWTDTSARLRRAVILLPLLCLVLLLFSKKAYTNYLTIFYFPLALVLASRAQTRRGIYQLLLGLGLFNALATLEPSLWYRWMEGMTITQAWNSPAIAPAHVLLFAGLEFALIAGYILLATLSAQTFWKTMTRPERARP